MKRKIFILLLLLLLFLIAIAVAGVMRSSGQIKNDFLTAVNAGNLVEIKSIIHKNQGIIDACLSDGWTALTVAARDGNLNAVILLLDEGADINKLEGGGNSALFWAVYYDHEDVVSVLLRYGALVNNKCEKCRDPVDVARDRVGKGILRLLTHEN